MRRSHLAAFGPVCPRCRADFYRDSPVRLAVVRREDGDHIIEGALHCTDPSCLMEYPIIDGIPLLVTNLRRFISDNIAHLQARTDLDAHTESLLGDALGPNAAFNTTRQYLSSYTWDHYADLDPEDPETESGVVACLAGVQGLTEPAPDGPAVDIGCSVGRTAFQLAETRSGLVLGVDLNLAMLRVATRVLRDGVVDYPRRRVGIVYERRTFDVDFEAAERVDFWCCDATALPVQPGRLAVMSGLNVLDCVTSPLDLLGALARGLMPGGLAYLATPYDWSPGATPVEAWIGGHSQRGPHAGATEPLLTALLTPGAHPQAVPGLRIAGEQDRFPWRVRLHDRSTMLYDCHLLALRRE